MAQTSRKLRKIRRIRRERTLALYMAAQAMKERDQARLIAGALERELKKYTDDPFPEDTPVAPESPKVTITRVEDPTVEVSGQ